ncbi:MAG: rod shape-determining protein MreC [Minisyncoccota bacterium]
MNSLLKSKPKSNTKKVFITTVIICVIITLIQFLFPRFISSSAITFAKPIWAIRDGIFSGTSSFSNYFSRISTLQKENDDLRNNLYELRVKEFEFNQIKQEYNELKSLVHATSSNLLIVGRVISKPPFTPYDTFIVDKGSNNGVQVGDFGYINDGLVIGRVTTVNKDNCVVTLFSSGDQSQEFLVSRTGISVLVVGKGGGNFAMFVPKDFDIVIGDTLLEPSHDTSIVAEVYTVNDVAQNSFKMVYARIPQSIFQSKIISIGRQ